MSNTSNTDNTENTDWPDIELGWTQDWTLDDIDWGTIDELDWKRIEVSWEPIDITWEMFDWPAPEDTPGGWR